MIQFHQQLISLVFFQVRFNFQPRTICNQFIHFTEVIKELELSFLRKLLAAHGSTNPTYWL